MYAFFDKFGKKLLAVVAAMLALAFILPSTGGRGGSGGPRLGTVDGKAIDLAEVQSAQAALQTLERVIITRTGEDGHTRSVPLPTAMLGDSLQRQFSQNPLHLYLLIHEARQAGAAVDERSIDQYLGDDAQYAIDNNHQLPMDRVSASVKESLRDSLRQVLSVKAYARRTRAAVKVSRPLVDDELARAVQQVKVRVATLDAADYAGKVATPTDAESRKQFDAYKNVAPGAPGDATGFGFGYLVPDRLGVQYLVVPQAEVAKAVEAGQTAGRWEEDAIIYYRNHRTAYQTATTQPTTRPYAEVRDDVLRTLREPKTADKSRQVAVRIAQALDAMAPKPSPAPTTGPATRTSVAGDAFTFDALQKVADAVQKQTGVRPTVVAPAGALSFADLQKQPGFGQTDGPAYVFDRLRALHPIARNDAPLSSPLDLGRPTPALPGPDGLYVARVVSLDPAHAAAYDDVKAIVEKDVRRTKAFDLAAADAKAMLEKAAAGGGLAGVAKDVQTSQAFGVDATAPAGLAGDWTAGIVGPAFDALRGLASAAALPVRTVARLPSADRVAVIEVFDVQTSLTTSMAGYVRSDAEQTLRQRAAPPDAIEQWLAFDSVARRQNYQPDAAGPENRKPDPTGPAGPANPFTPG